MKSIYITCLLALIVPIRAADAHQQLPVNGRVTQPDGQPIEGVSIKATHSQTSSGVNGEFSMSAAVGDTLLFSHMGFRNKSVRIEASRNAALDIVLEPNSTLIEEVQVNTGYQVIPRERSTGSYAHLDSSILNRRISTDILSRLEDVTPGLIFNRSGKTKSDFNIRGQNTVVANSDPLIVIDNFPYEGDINNINPNDVESITVLKDASAASIWGSRAGNGVIVITTKKGRYGQRPVFSFNSNITMGNKPDLFYRPAMPVADYIETERRLFKEGFYANQETSNNRVMLTPVVELLIAARDGLISEAEADARIAALKAIDTRSELSRYINRTPVNQQYSLGLRGGGTNQRYHLSLGYDGNRTETVNTGFERLSLNANQTHAFLDGRLEMDAGIFITHTTRSQPHETVVTPYPYAHLANGDGSAAVVSRDRRTAFLHEAEANGLLDWQYRPLDELDPTRVSKQLHYRLNAGLRYRILPGLSVSGLYQYVNDRMDGRNLRPEDSYFARNLINTYSQLSGETIVRPIPLGGILDLQQGNTRSQNLRGQVQFEKDWTADHKLSALAGVERREQYGLTNTYRLYGYDDRLALSVPVDYANRYPSYVNPASQSTIPNSDDESDLTDRYLSYYATLGYTFRNRYTLTASARKDQSNMFGTRSNRKGIPLYSIGAAWQLDREPFFSADWISSLRIRATYGYNGNSFTSIYAFTTAGVNNGSSSLTRLPFARIGSPPNPDLKWERTGIANTGVDFAFWKNRVSGSFEYYWKRTRDLLGNIEVPASTGLTTYQGNFGVSRGRGFELVLNTENLAGKLRWQTNVLLSMAKDELVEYTATADARVSSSVMTGTLNVYEGRPIYSISSYEWAGLNPENGNPRGYLDGAVSEDYNAIIGAATFETIHYHGYSEPPYFGALRNTFSYKGLSVSANVSFRLGYFLRRDAVLYSNNYGLGTVGDYNLRWQKPGDETHTYVPSVPETFVSGRDNFFRWSAALVDKGDHIRLQDVRIDYRLPDRWGASIGINSIQFSLYANNLGVLWKASRFSGDPDFPMQKPLRTYAFGLTVGF